MTAAQYEAFYFSTGALLAATGVIDWGVEYATASHEARAPLRYRTRLDQLGTTIRDTTGPLVMILQTGNSRAVGSQKTVNLIKYPVAETTTPPTALLYSGLMFKAGPNGTGLRGAGAADIENAIYGVDDLLDFEPAYEQIYDGTALGETNGSACLAYLAEKIDDAGDDPEVFLWRTHGAAGAELAEVLSGTQPYLNGLIEARYARYVARHYGFPSPYVLFHSVTIVNGDQDRTIGTSRATFAAGLSALLADYDADLKAISGQTQDVLMLVVQLAGQCQSNAVSGSDVSLAQLDFVRAEANARMIMPAYVLQNDDTDDLHYHPRGYQTMGRYQAAVIRYEMLGGEWVALGQEITVTRDGATIDVKFWRDRLHTVPWENLQFKTDDALLEVHPGGFYGVDYSDDTSSASVSAVAIVNNGGTANCLRVTLNTAPTGANKFLEIAWDGPGTTASHAATWSNLCDDATDPGPNYCLALKEAV